LFNCSLAAAVSTPAFAKKRGSSSSVSIHQSIRGFLTTRFAKTVAYQTRWTNIVRTLARSAVQLHGESAAPPRPASTYFLITVKRMHIPTIAVRAYHAPERIERFLLYHSSLCHLRPTTTLLRWPCPSHKEAMCNEQ